MEEPKKRKSRYNEAQNKATQRYIKAHLDDVKFRVPKGQRDYYKAVAAAYGTSFAKFVVSAMDEKIERDGIRVDTAGLENENKE